MATRKATFSAAATGDMARVNSMQSENATVRNMPVSYRLTGIRLNLNSPLAILVQVGLRPARNKEEGMVQTWVTLPGRIL